MASLQDDNLNVSSSLASLSVRCSNEITALLANLTDLHKKIGAVEAVQSMLEASEGEERLVQLNQQNNDRSDTDANVEENSDTKDAVDRTEHEDKGKKLQDSQQIL